MASKLARNAMLPVDENSAPQRNHANGAYIACYVPNSSAGLNAVDSWIWRESDPVQENLIPYKNMS
jgi:hypothetical protein